MATQELVKKEPDVVIEVPEDTTQKEIAAQAEDWEKARVEAKSAGQDPDGDYIITEGLPAPFFLLRRYRGVGPLAYETKRGLVKVNSGEIIAGFYYHEHDAEGNDLEEQLEEFIIMTEAAFLALQDDFTSDNLPESLAVRSVKIGDARRPKPTPPIALEKKPPTASQLPTAPPYPNPPAPTPKK